MARQLLGAVVWDWLSTTFDAVCQQEFRAPRTIVRKSTSTKPAVLSRLLTSRPVCGIRWTIIICLRHIGQENGQSPREPLILKGLACFTWNITLGLRHGLDLT